MNRKFLILLTMLATALSVQLSVATATKSRTPKLTQFTVRIENISSPDGQTAADGTRWPFALSPGMWVLNEKRAALFAEGKRASSGLEMQAEDGNPEGLIRSLEMNHHSSALHGVFNTPAGAMGAGPIGPGAAYEFKVNATPGMKLSLALMFGQSNDLFYANDAGIALFDNKGMPFSGDVTSKIELWDAGTEVDQELGVGADQAPRQKAANTGAAQNGVVRRAKDSAFYAKTTQLFRVTVTPENGM